MLDILQLLSRSLEMDPNEHAPEFDVFNIPYKLRVMDNMNDREVSVNDRKINVNDREVRVNDREVRLNDRKVSMNVREIRVNDRKMSVNDKKVTFKTAKEVNVNDRGVVEDPASWIILV